MKTCSACDTHNDVDARFCKECAAGMPLGEEALEAMEKARRRAMFELLGQPDQTVGQKLWIGQVGPVFLHVWGPGSVRAMPDFDLHVVMTSGMSNVRLPQSGGDPRRLELIAWVPAMALPIAQYLLHLASFPGVTGEPLGPGSTLLDDAPPFPRSPMRATVLVPFEDQPFGRLARSLRIDGDPVHAVFPIPLTAGERDVLESEGMVAALDRFVPEFDYMFDPWRTPFA